MNEFNSSSRTVTEQQEFLNEGKFVASGINVSSLLINLGAIQDKIMPALQALLSKYIDTFQNYLDKFLTIERIRFTIFILGSFAIFFFLWTPYLKKVRDDIWRTKGMLNMIPMEIITKNENLKNIFTSGELMQAIQ